MRGLGLAGAVLLLGCLPGASAPGDEQMGTFDFTAAPLERQCALDELSDAGFAFSAILSRSSADNRAWVTLQGYSRGADWDGQALHSTATARRAFTSCAACETNLTEQLDVALLSRSQSVVLGGQCPAWPLDGGVPGVDADAGVSAPAMTPLGFDAVRACGELVTELHVTAVVDGGVCPAECDGCRLRYRLTGDRQ